MATLGRPRGSGLSLLTRYGLTQPEGAPPGPTYTHYRLTISARQGSTYVEIAEFSLRTTPGGSSAAPGSGGTATTNSQYNADYGAAKAFDGDLDTSWVSHHASSLPIQIGFQFPTAIRIVE